MTRYNQIIDLRGGATGEGEDFVIVSRNNQGFHCWSDFYFVIVAIDREVFYVISNTLVLVVIIQRVRLVRGRLPVKWDSPLHIILWLSWWGLGVALVSMMMVVVLVMPRRGSTSSPRHRLESHVCLLLGLLDDGINVRHHTVHPRYSTHARHTSEEKHIIRVSVHILKLPYLSALENSFICFKLYL